MRLRFVFLVILVGWSANDTAAAATPVDCVVRSPQVDEAVIVDCFSFLYGGYLTKKRATWTGILFCTRTDTVRCEPIVAIVVRKPEVVTFKELSSLRCLLTEPKKVECDYP